LIIEDTTLLDYSGSAAALELGTIGDGGGRGFELHSALVLRVEQWSLEQRPEAMLVGLLGQQCDCPRPRPEGETEGQRLQRARKSQRWTAALKAAGAPPAGCQWIYVADRESDFYEPIQTCQQHAIDVIIRSRCNRRLAGEAGHLWDALAQEPSMGQTTVQLRGRGSWTVPGGPEAGSPHCAGSGPWRCGKSTRRRP
jgi:hypothetical protein